MQDGRLSRTLSYEIVGTDISPTALTEAQGASYCGVSASRGLSDDQRRRYFREQGGCIEVLPQYRQGHQLSQFQPAQAFRCAGQV